MKNPEETEQHIIRAAAPVFNKKGYAGTSLSDVLEMTRLTKGAIYHHFANKDELAIAALEYNLNLVSLYSFKAIKDRPHSCDKLAAFAGSFRKNYNSLKQIGGCPVVNAAIDSDDGNEQIRRRVTRFLSIWKKTLMQIIEEGRSKGEIRPEIDTEAFSMNLISLIEGSIAMSRVSDDRRFVDNAVDLAKSLIDEIRKG